jgi:histidyl-tRNA synthetase
MGVVGATIRVNHRELLKSNIASLGVAESDALSAMITIDKLDKVGIEGVAAELGEKFGSEVSEAATKWLNSIGSLQIPDVLAPIFEADFSAQLRFDPTLVRGMGYYTGSIFEIEHPESSSSIGGGGRYDGMIGRWLGEDVPAVGISLGIERIVDLVPGKGSMRPGLVLLIDGPEQGAKAMRIQNELMKDYRVRLELRPKNLKAVLGELADSFDFFATLGEAENAAQLEIKPLS